MSELVADSTDKVKKKRSVRVKYVSTFVEQGL